jgi:hypothetical protein
VLLAHIAVSNCFESSDLFRIAELVSSFLTCRSCILLASVARQFSCCSHAYSVVFLKDSNNFYVLLVMAAVYNTLLEI